MKAQILFSVPALLLALFAGTADAECTPPPVSARPSVPDGGTATAEAMFASQQQVADYVTSIESYLECRQGRLPYAIHDGLLSRAEKAAEDYNVELRKYRARDSEVAQN